MSQRPITFCSKYQTQHNVLIRLVIYSLKCSFPMYSKWHAFCQDKSWNFAVLTCCSLDGCCMRRLFTVLDSVFLVSNIDLVSGLLAMHLADAWKSDSNNSEKQESNEITNVFYSWWFSFMYWWTSLRHRSCLGRQMTRQRSSYHSVLAWCLCIRTCQCFHLACKTQSTVQQLAKCQIHPR